MPLKEGDLAGSSDVWLRVLTNPDYITKEGKVHNRAFGGKAIAPPTAKKPYSLEFSGRLLSLVKDVEKESADFCKNPPLKYMGVIYQLVEKIRNEGKSEKPGFRTDVVYTPIKDRDEAHADVVAYDLTTENKYLLRDWLQEVIMYVPAGRCDTLEKLRPALAK